MKLQIYRVLLYQERDSGTDVFLCEFWEISQKTFLKEPFGWLLLHKHSFRLLSQQDLVPFQKRCYTYFPAEYFLCFFS